jgi:hypothetical protein
MTFPLRAKPLYREVEKHTILGAKDVSGDVSHLDLRGAFRPQPIIGSLYRHQWSLKAQFTQQSEHCSPHFNSFLLSDFSLIIHSLHSGRHHKGEILTLRLHWLLQS